MTVAGRTGLAGFVDFTLESGYVFPQMHIAYETFGRLNSDRSNAILIEHALTGDAHVTSGVDEPATAEHPRSFAPGWWEEVVGAGRAIDTDEFFVVCANAIGGCNGSTGPTSTHSDGLPFGSRFPRVTIRDLVQAELALSDELGIDRWHAVIGGSMGGARALEFSLVAPHRVAKTSVLAAPAFSEADQIAWAHAQIQAIELDPDYCGGDYAALGRFPAAGLGLARQIAHLTYRADAELNARFTNAMQDPQPSGAEEGYYAVESYLDYQARKLVNRFDAESYRILTGALRDHDVRRGRSQNLAEALAPATSEFQVISISSDRLYPPAQVNVLAEALPGSVDHHTISSWAGHDGFLTEGTAVGRLVRDFIS
jgi:homoserine O-acetyltransferase/O-succinyltransferase